MCVNVLQTGLLWAVSQANAAY